MEGYEFGQSQAGPPASPGIGGSAALSKNEVSDPNWGFKFPLPKGWKVEKGSKGAVLGHDTIPGLLTWHAVDTFRTLRVPPRYCGFPYDLEFEIRSPRQGIIDTKERYPHM